MPSSDAVKMSCVRSIPSAVYRRDLIRRKDVYKRQVETECQVRKAEQVLRELPQVEQYRPGLLYTSCPGRKEAHEQRQSADPPRDIASSGEKTLHIFAGRGEQRTDEHDARCV